jgi:sensor histidine kinase regulating citrate/malate metabolism
MARLVFTMIVLCVVIMIFIKVAVPMIAQKTKKAAAEKTVEVITQNAEIIAGDNEEVKEAIQNMSEEDKETLTEIVEDHMDAETVSEVMGYVEKKDKEGLMKYASENLSEEEIIKLIGIYSKYANP